MNVRVISANTEKYLSINFGNLVFTDIYDVMPNELANLPSPTFTNLLYWLANTTTNTQRYIPV